MPPAWPGQRGALSTQRWARPAQRGGTGEGRFDEYTLPSPFRAFGTPSSIGSIVPPARSKQRGALFTRCSQREREMRMTAR
jgi:hypothetical protein